MLLIVALLLVVFGAACAWWAVDRPHQRGPIEWAGGLSMVAGLVLIGLALQASVGDMQSRAAGHRLTEAAR